MKIDIHTHTKKCKKGDASTREVTPDQFRKAIQDTQVGIIAITNHNVFDLTQYEAISAAVKKDEVQVWPGIEFDVVEKGERGHLIVVVSPKQAAAFSKIVTRLTDGSTPDTFTISFQDIVKEFDGMGPVYIAHYHKAPKISEASLEVLVSATKHKNRVIKEVTNAISAGIYISHGHSSIYGSDLHDWNAYRTLAESLPELRLPVSSFEQFCLLLDKDPAVINTLLSEKAAEPITILPFEDKTKLALNIYDDITILFGSKGTGKSCILKAIAKHYASKGMPASVFESGKKDQLESEYKFSDHAISINLNPLNIHYCTDEILAIRSAVEADVSSLKGYLSYFKTDQFNKKAKTILFQNMETEQAGTSKRKLSEHITASKTASDFLAFFQESPAIRSVLNAEEFKTLSTLLGNLIKGLKDGSWTHFTTLKEIDLLNSSIAFITKEVANKAGKPARPLGTGFQPYALNRLKIEKDSLTVLESIKKTITYEDKPVGNLGIDKGILYFREEYRFHDGADKGDPRFHSSDKTSKRVQAAFVKNLQQIIANVYTEGLFGQIDQLNKDDEDCAIVTVLELLLIRRSFILNGKTYTPSSGEASMLLLQRELSLEKEVYLLDEPERSLGNDYINDVIVPLIKEKARNGKKVFISTHDANIAVRTLPYCSIFRRHGATGYETFVGNPFTNDLVNLASKDDRLDWKKYSMKTLEGGEAAFSERGKIYGNH